MAVSLKDIANKLNLSTATVSLTLSGQGDARKVILQASGRRMSDLKKNMTRSL